MQDGGVAVLRDSERADECASVLIRGMQVLGMTESLFSLISSSSNARINYKMQ